MVSNVHPSRMHDRHGFTLVEMAMVIVIIGLLVGAVLVGRDMISAAKVRAQVSQIEKYQTAVNVFREKYNCLPGDCKNAANFGFPARGTYGGQGDGNEIIEGNRTNSSVTVSGSYESAGETVMFWVDLSMANLIEGTFNTASSTLRPAVSITSATSPNLDAYFPAAELGNGRYVYAWSGGTTTDRINYFGLDLIIAMLSASCGGVGSGYIDTKWGMSVQEAYNIDKKVDDGKPQGGSVQAFGLYCVPRWASTWITSAPYTTATPGSSTTCFDNNNVAGVEQKYSTQMNNGSNMLCALSFRMR